MFRKKHLLLCAIGLAGSVGQVSGTTIDEISSFGVYAVAEKGYVQVNPNHEYGKRFDFYNINEASSVIRKSEKVKLIIHTAEFKQKNYAFSLREIGTDVIFDEINFTVKPLKGKNMYEFTLNEPVQDGTLVKVDAHDIFGYKKVGVFVLGDTEKELVKYFSDKKMEQKHSVLAMLEDSVQAYPENKQLADLLPYWKKASKAKKAEKIYSNIEKSWDKYSATTKIRSKVWSLKVMLGDVKRYLRDHPDGEKVEDVKQRKAYAEKKIAEYEALL